MATFVETVMDQLAADAVQQRVAELGIDPDLARSAVSATAAGVLEALTTRYTTETDAAQLLELLSTDTARVAGLLRSAEGAKSLGVMGAAANDALFGDQAEAVAGCIRSATGISAGAAESLLNYVTPLVLAELSREVKQHGLDETGLVRLLDDQRGAIAKALPASLGACIRKLSYAATTVGVYDIPEPKPTPKPKQTPAPAARVTPPPVQPEPGPKAEAKPVMPPATPTAAPQQPVARVTPRPPAPPPPPAPSIWRWLIPLLGLLLLGALALWLLRSCASDGTTTPTPVPVTATPVAGGAPQDSVYA